MTEVEYGEIKTIDRSLHTEQKQEEFLERGVANERTVEAGKLSVNLLALIEEAVRGLDYLFHCLEC